MEKIYNEGRFFSVVEEDGKFRVRIKKDGEFIPLESLTELNGGWIDAYADFVLGYWEPLDINEVKQYASFTNRDLRDKADTVELALSIIENNAKATSSKTNMWIWIIALCMFPFSWGISLCLLFFLRTATPAIEEVTKARNSNEKSSEFLEKQRDCAREYLDFLSKKEYLEKQ